MSQGDPGSRNISNNHFGDKVTIHQGDVHNHASDQARQCLKDLRSTDPRDDKTRIQNTKGGLLKDSYRWILEHETFKDWRDNAENRILWIKGDPGKGKTMLLCGIIDELMPMTKLTKSTAQTTNDVLLSYFFCQGTDARINNATAVLRGLIYLLIIQEPSLISHVQTKYEHAGKDLFSDANAWVALSEIFVAMLQDSKAKEVILIIDALDECETDSPKLLDTVIQQLAPLHVKCIVSSRNILGIQQRLELYIPQGILSLELKGNAACVSEAVDAYIKHSVSRLASIRNNQRRQDEIRKMIQQKANGTFLWVSLVMKELEEVQIWEMMEVIEEMPTDLTALYERMINNIHRLKRSKNKLCRNILSAIFTAYYPLSLAEVGVLAGLPDQISEDLESIANLIAMCGSFLTLNDDSVYFIHQSAKDFLSTEMYLNDVAQKHLVVFERSVAAISKLHRNIYGLTDFGPRPEDAQPPDPNPLASMKYSSFYWANHFCDALATNTKNEAQKIISETLDPFLQSYFLRWIESLSLLDGLPEGLRSIRKLLHELPHDENSQFAKFLSTIETFVLRNGALLAESPLQVYGSALIFNPLHDDTIATHWKERLWKERLAFIEDIQGIGGNCALRTIKGHTKDVQALAFSYNGAMLASKAQHEELHCWDVATGALKWTIQCYDVGASAIAFSPDNTMLLLATRGDPMQKRTREEIWEKGAEGLGYWITYITLSPTTGMLDASHRNCMVRLNVHKPIDEDDEWISAFAFSSDCKILASGLPSGSIRLWDATTGLLRQTIQRHDEQITGIAVSLDGGEIASVSMDKLRLWDAATGALLEELKWHVIYGKTVVFCQESKKLLSAGYLHDLKTGIVMRTSMGDYYSVIAISPDNKILASAGVAIHLWDATMGIQEEDESDGYGVFALSLDGKTVACATSNTVQIWDTATGECQRTIEDYWPDVIAQQEFTSLRKVRKDAWRFDYTAGAFAADGKILALGSMSYPIMLNLLPKKPPIQIQTWDTTTGECTYRKTLDRKCEIVRKLAFSPDGNRLAVGIISATIILLDIVADVCLWEVELGIYSVPTSLAFFPDNSMLASVHCSYKANGKLQIDLWDIATGERRQTFDADIPDGEICDSLIFLPDGRYLRLEHEGEVRLFQENEKALSLDLDLSNGLQVQRIPFIGGWIKKDGTRLLWIPEAYRTKFAFLCGNTIVIGHASGVSFIWLNP